ncbi:MAG: hypothetical protein R6V53_02705 [Candidatus Woesearchaeota archaeon]
MTENVRIPENTLDKMYEVRYTTEPFAALNGYVDLIENYWMTERKKSRKWKPYEPFRQVIPNEGFLFNNELQARVDYGEMRRLGRLLEVMHPKLIGFFDTLVTYGKPVSAELDSGVYVTKKEDRGIVVKPFDEVKPAEYMRLEDIL